VTSEVYLFRTGQWQFLMAGVKSHFRHNTEATFAHVFVFDKWKNDIRMQ